MKDHIRRRRSSASRKYVGVRELKANAARILREVRDSRASYVLTHRGKPIGVILPLEPESDELLEHEAKEAWADFWEAGRLVQKALRPGESPMRELFKMRNER